MNASNPTFETRPVLRPVPPTTPLGKQLLAVWAIALAVGLWGVFLRFTQGHLPAGYGSAVPWGLWIALYFHGVGISGGVFLLGAGGYLLNLPGFRSKFALRTTIILSFAAIVPAFMGVWFDLGHMDRAAAIFTRPRFTSMMAFNAWMYNAYMILAVICFLLSLKRESAWLKPLLCLALLFTVLFPSQSGGFFAVVVAKEFWHTALLPVLFLTSAVTAGSATLFLVRGLAAPGSPTAIVERDAAMNLLRRVTIAGVLIYFVLEFAEFSIALWDPSGHSPAVELVLWGPTWWTFWIVHLLLGGIVALLLLGSGNRRNWLLGALLVAICFLSARLNVLIPGQLTGELLPGLQDAFAHPRLRFEYQATAMEWAVALFMLAVALTVFYAGNLVNRYLTARFPNGDAS